MNTSFSLPPPDSKNFENFFILREESKMQRITYSYPMKPHIINNMYPNIMQFCYPEPPDTGSRYLGGYAGENSFTFVLTDDAGIRTFGFCTRCVSGDCYVILSKFAWIRVFSSLVYTYRANSNDTRVIEDFYNTPLPLPGSVFAGTNVTRPHDNICFFIDASPVDMLGVFTLDDLFVVLAALLTETHVVIVGPNFSLVSRVCLSLLAMISPFEWQHILIPVLPHDLIEVLASPTPYLCGILSSQIPQFEKVEIENVTVVQLTETGKCSNVTIFPETERPPRLPKTKFPSALRAKLQAMGFNKKNTSARKLMMAFVDYYADMVGDVGSSAFSESATKARHNPDHKEFFEALFRTQQLELLKREMGDKFRNNTWTDDAFMVAAVKSHSKVYTPSQVAAAKSAPRGGSSSGGVGLLRRFGGSCERAAVVCESDVGEEDCEMLERNRSLSRASSTTPGSSANSRARSGSEVSY